MVPMVVGRRGAKCQPGPVEANHLAAAGMVSCGQPALLQSTREKAASIEVPKIFRRVFID
jgi:hypothetical protein